MRCDGRRHPPPLVLDAREGSACQPVGCGHGYEDQGRYTPLLLLRQLGHPARLGIAEHGSLQLLVEAHDLILLQRDPDAVA